MKTKYIFIAFALTALLQAFVPLKMVYDNYNTETEGTVFKFKTEPVDPSDPFRGKYITLNFTSDSVYANTNPQFKSDENVYAVIDTDAQGYAKIKSVQRERPQDKTNYITTTVRYHNGDGRVFVNLPFDRYYMEESKAPDAEIMYNNYVRSENSVPAYALVAIKDGRAVLTDVIIDGLPVKEYVIKNRNDAIKMQP